jgi:hypothetical protein
MFFDHPSGVRYGKRIADPDGDVVKGNNRMIVAVSLIHELQFITFKFLQEDIKIAIWAPKDESL